MRSSRVEATADSAIHLLRYRCASVAVLASLVALIAMLGCERRSEVKAGNMKNNYFVRCAR
jgi:hypothetical protein